MKLIVIIPTFNEEDSITKLIHFLKHHADKRLLEIIVCNWHSNHHTVSRAVCAGTKELEAPLRV
ncbi:MAG: glycosyltransferase [Cyclobacteriaceae bacterium]